MKCPKCGKPVAIDSALKCPKCGKPVAIDSAWPDGVLLLICSDNDMTIGPVCEWDRELGGKLLETINESLERLPQELLGESSEVS